MSKTVSSTCTMIHYLGNHYLGNQSDNYFLILQKFRVNLVIKRFTNGKHIPMACTETGPGVYGCAHMCLCAHTHTHTSTWLESFILSELS